MFPALPGQSGYNKRLRRLAHTIAWLIASWAPTPASATTSVGGRLDPRGVCPLDRDGQRSDLAGWAQYGYCASHSRYFWGLRLHLLCTVHGLPLGWALTGAKADERDVLTEILTTTPTLVSNTGHRRRSSATRTTTAAPSRPHWPTTASPCSDPPATARTPPPGHRFFKPLRQIIESVNDTLKGQLDLEHHGGRTIAGVCTRVAQRLLALTAAIWHNDPRPHHPPLPIALRPLTPESII